MQLSEVASFDVVRDQLSWPWITFDAHGRRFAFPSSPHHIASRTLGNAGPSAAHAAGNGAANLDTSATPRLAAEIVAGPTFTLPADLPLPSVPPKDEPTRDARPGVHGFSLDATGTRLAVTGIVGEASVLVTCDDAGEQRRSTLDTLAGAVGFIAQAVAFDRSGARLWISAESETETALLLVDAGSHAVLGIAKSAPFPPPATHELYVHPQDDAVLLLAACGQDGTFARVVRFAESRVKGVWTSLEGGGMPAGMVGFSADATRVHLAEADELRTHAWPGMKELSSVQFDDDFVASYSGAVLGDQILVDGQDSETKEDAVMMFDATGTKGVFLAGPVPSGMWAGRLGTDVLVTVEAKGEPLRGRVIRVVEA